LLEYRLFEGVARWLFDNHVVPIVLNERVDELYNLSYFAAFNEYLLLSHGYLHNIDCLVIRYRLHNVKSIG